MAPPIELHYWPTSNGHKIPIALEEMGLAYRVTPVNIDEGQQFQPSFLAISPNNRIPAIIDPEGPDGKPISVFESGAILQYLVRKTGLFYPADARQQVQVDEWLFWQVGGLGPMAGQAHHFRGKHVADQRQIAYAANRYTAETHRLYGVLERRLAGRDYICGELSIADMACWPWINSWTKQAIDLADYPGVAAWRERLQARPSVQAALRLGVEVRAGRVSPDQIQGG